MARTKQTPKIPAPKKSAPGAQSTGVRKRKTKDGAGGTAKKAGVARKKKAAETKARAPKKEVPKTGAPKRKSKDDAGRKAKDEAEQAEEEGDADEVVIEEDPYVTKEELEALEEQLGCEDLAKQRPTASREPAACLGLPLLPYQKEFLAWGIDQELSSIRGGVLADEMGMGKTLQAVSIIVTHPRDGQILGPDSSPAAAAAPVQAPAPKLKLRLPSNVANPVQTANEGAPQRTPRADVEEAQPETVALPAPEGATSLQAAEAECAAEAGPSTLQSPEPTKAAKKGSSTPSTAKKKDQPGESDAGAAQQEGGGSPEGKTTNKGKSKAKKKRIDPLVAAMQQAKECYAEPEAQGTDGFCGATLVVCPVVAAMQWQQEIIRYTGAGTLNVVLYHGTNRGDKFTQEQLEKADVVLTSYSILEADYRRNVMAPKATCNFCGRKFQPERLKVHLRYFCGPYAHKTDAQAKQLKKRAPWLVGRGGGGGGTGDDKTDSKGKAGGKGSAGASTSKACAKSLDDDDLAKEGTGQEADESEADVASSSEEEEPVKPKKQTQGGKAAASKAKSKAEKAKGETAAGNSDKVKTGKGGASTSNAKGSDKAPKTDHPAPKRRRTAAQSVAVSGGGDSSGSDADSDFMESEQPDAAPGPVPKGDTAGPSSKKTGAKVPPAKDTRGKVTRARASKPAAGPPAGSPLGSEVEMLDESGSDVELLDADEPDEAPAKRGTVGGKRKRSDTDADAGGKAASKGKPRAATGATKANAKTKRKKSKIDASDSEGDSDWDPGSDDEKQQEADEVETSADESVVSVVSEEVQGEEEEDAAVEEEEEDVLEVPETKKSKKKKKDEAEEELDRQVNEAAAKMIAAANKERAGKPDGVSILHEIRWRRAILDEAHNIKDRRSNTAQAAFALTARYRWCLTGTPLQNRVTELYSLIRFLRLHPFAHYFADKTNCCSLDFPFKNDVRKCDLCQGSRMSHYCWWNRRVANPIKYNGYEGRGHTAMLILKHQILPKMLLRRTKLQCAADLALPPRTVVLRKDPFDVQEADFYEALYTQSQAAFGGYVDSGTVLNNYAHIFDLLIRLRQAVNHPYLVVYSASGNKSAPGSALGAGGDGANTSSQGGDCGRGNEQMMGICGICHDPVEDGIGAACGHAFCRICVSEYLGASDGTTTCPTCNRPLCIDLRAPATNGYTADATASPGKENQAAPAPAGSMVMPKFKKRSILSRINMASFQSSTKLEALREEIHNMLSHDPSAKCIVFSQFTSMLDLVQYRLSQVGVRCVKMEGSMSLDARNKTIKEFNESPSVPCFLMSLKAGGVALNLTVASHVMLMDPWWNPAVEQQAQDRIHRLGQFKPITVTRFVIAGTIEERILKLQDKKQLVFEGTVGRDSQALGKLTVDDLRFLFG